MPGELLARIEADAKKRANASSENVVVVKAERVTWSDGSLGCPQPGMAYTQALVPGYWVVIDVDGVAYDYRVSARGGFRLCPPRSSTAAVKGMINPEV